MSQPCGGLNNGFIRFKILGATGGATGSASVQIFGPVNQSFPFSIPVGGTFDFNATKTLPVGTYNIIVFDNNDGDNFINSFGVDPPVVLTALPAITLTDGPGTNLTNSDCGNPDGGIEVSLAGGSRTLAGGGSYAYTWSATNSLAGLPLSGTFDGTTSLNLATLLGLGGLPGGDYTLSITDNYSQCGAAKNWTITDPQPSVQTITNAGTQSVCQGQDATVLLGGSEVGVSYEVLINGAGSGVTKTGTGGALSFTVPSGSFSNNQVLTVEARFGACSPRNMTGAITISIKPLPTATVSGGGSVCAGQTLPNVTFTFTGTAPFTFTYTDGTTPVTITNHPTTSFTITNAPAGTYSVTALTDANTCAATGAGLGTSASVIVNPLPTATISGGGPACIGSPLPNVIFTFTGTAPFTFTYTDGTTPVTITNHPTNIFTITNAPVGTYSVSALSDANTCAGTNLGTPVAVTINPRPTAVVSGGGTVCAGAPLPGVTFTFTGTAPFTFTYTDGITPVTITNHPTNTFTIAAATAGSYSITSLTDANGCTATGPGLGTPVSVIVNPRPTATITGGGPVCTGAPLPNIVFTFTGTAPFTFTYTDGTTPVTITNHPTSSFTITNAPVGTYSITALSDANTCVGTNLGTPVAVTINALPTATISGGGTVCSGSTLPNVVFTFTGTAPFTFTYTVGGTPVTVTNHPTSTFTITNATAGSYSITALTDANGCSATGPGLGTPVAVVVNPRPTVTISGGGPVCTGAPLPNIVFTFTGTAPFTFTYTDGTTPVTITNHPTSTFTITNAAAGNYSVTALSDANTCIATGAGLGTPLAVTINPLPTATISGGGTVCTGLPRPNIVFTFTGTAPFTFTYTDGTTPVTVTNHPTSTFTITNPTAGTYSITALTDANSCGATGAGLGTPVAVVVTPRPTVTISGGGPVCAGAPLPNIVFTFTGTAPFTFTYTDGTTPVTITNHPTSTFTVTNAAAGNYSVTALTDANTCNAAGAGLGTPVAVTVSPRPTVTISGGGTVCNGTPRPNIIFTFTGTAPFTFTYNRGAGPTTVTNHPTNTFTLTNPVAGTYTITALTDASGCAATGAGLGTPVAVVVNPRPTVVISGGGTVCAGAPLPNIVFTFTGTAPFTFTYTDGTTPVTVTNHPTNTFTITNAAAGNYSVSALSDANTCNATGAGLGTPRAVTVRPLPTATISGGGTVCSGLPRPNIVFTFTGTAPFTFTYTDGTTPVTVTNHPTSTFTITNPTAGTYSITALTDANSCGATGAGLGTPVAVVVNPRPTVAISGGGQVCTGAPLPNIVFTFTGTAPFTFTYTDGTTPVTVTNHPTSTFTITSAAAGNYSVTSLTDASICPATGAGLGTPVAVTVNPRPTVVISGGGTVCAGAPLPNIIFTFTGTAPFTFTYTDGTTPVTITNHPTSTFTITNAAAGNYSVTALADANTCPATGGGLGTPVAVTVSPRPTVTISGGGPVCTGDPLPNIIFTFTGTAPFTFTYTDGTTPVTITNHPTSTFTITNAAGGNYSVTSLTDASICPATGAGLGTPVAVTVNPRPTVAISGGGTVCAGAPLPNIIFTFTGTAPFTFTYTDGTTPVTITNHPTSTFTLTNAPAGNYSVTALADANTCPATGAGLGTPVAVTVSPRPTVTISGGGPVCTGDPLPNIIFTFTGTAPFTFTYTDGTTPVTITNHPTSTFTISNAAGGNYSVTSLTDASICPATGAGLGTPVAVTVNPRPTVAISGGGPVCAGAPLPNIIFTFTGTAPFTFTYTDGTTPVTITNHPTSTFTITNAPAGNYSLTALADANTCPGTGAGLGTPVAVTVNPRPTVAISGGGTVCFGDPRPNIIFTFTGTAPFTFTYTDGTTPVTITNHPTNTFTITNATAGNYSVTSLTDASTCPATGAGLGTPAAVTVNPRPTVAISGGGPVCAGAPLPNIVFTFTGTAPFTFTYTDGATPVTITNHPTSTFTITSAAAGNYSVTALTDANTCNATGAGLGTPAAVTVRPLPTATISGGGTVCTGLPRPNIVFTFTGTAPFTFTYTDGTTPVTITNHPTSTFTVTNPTAGTYSITALTDANSCGATGAGLGTPVAVVVNPRPTVAISGGGPVCTGDPLPNIVFTFTGTAPFTFTYTDGTTPVTITNHPTSTFTITNAAAGNYSVTALSDANTCGATGAGLGTPVAVTVRPLPTVTISGGGPVCAGTPLPNIVFTFTGTAPFTFTYTDGTTPVTITNHPTSTFTITTAAAGTYSVTALSDANTCNATGAGLGTPVAVTVNPSPTVVISGGGAVCTGDPLPNIVFTFTGTAPFTFTYTDGTTPVTITSHPTSTFTITNAAVGNYSVTSLTDASSCPASGAGLGTPVAVSVNPRPTVAISGGGPVCSGDPLPNIIFTFTGTAPFTFTYTDGTTPVTITSHPTSTFTITNAAAGNYSVTSLTDASVCPATGTGFGTPVAVTVNPRPTVAISGGGPVCSGDPLPNIIFTFTGTAPFTFTYTDGTTPVTITNHPTSTFTITNAAVGNYSVTSLTDASTCPATGAGFGTPVAVTVNQAITASIDPVSPVCSGDPLPNIVMHFTGTAPFDFTYTVDGAPTVVTGHNTATFTITNAAVGTYKVTALDDASTCPTGSLGTAVSVIVNTSPTATFAAVPARCAGDPQPTLTINLTGTAPFDFTYTVNGTPVAVSGHGSLTYTIPTAADGTYIITALDDATSCPATGLGSPVVVGANPPITASIDPVAPVCVGDPLPNVVMHFTGTAPFDFTYTVDGTPTSITGHNTATFTITNAAVGTYKVTALDDASSCPTGSLGTAVAVVVNTAPTSAVLSLASTGSLNVCAGTSTDLVVNITGGTGPFTLDITGLGTVNNYVSGTAIPVSPTANTTYTLGNVIDVSSCTLAGTGSVAITVNPAITNVVLGGSLNTCGTGSANLVVTITGGTGPYSFTIDNGVGLISNYTSGTAIPVSPTATTTYSFVGNVADASSCTFTPMDTHTITVGTAPAAPTLGGAATACEGHPEVYTTDPSMTNYVWNVQGGSIVANGTATDFTATVAWNFGPGTHSISVNYKDPGGCDPISAAVINVNVSDSPLPTIGGGSPTACVGAVVTYTTENGMVNYVWSVSTGGSITNGGTNVDAFAEVTWNTAGNQTVSVNYDNAGGCSAATATVFPVNVGAVPTPTILAVSGSTTECGGATVTYNTEAGMSNYVWNVTNGTKTAGGTAIDRSITIKWNNTGPTGTITVNYDNAASCAATTAATLTITINDAPTPTILGPALVCVDATDVTYTTEGGMTGYQWGVRGGNITQGGTGNFIKVTWPAHDPSDPSPYVRVRYTNAAGCGIAPAYTVLPITIGTDLEPGMIGDFDVCEDGPSVTYRTDAGQNNYVWNVSNNNGGTTIISGGTATDAFVEVTWAAPGSETVSVNYDNTVGCPTSTANTKTVTIHGPPTPTISGGSATQCVTDVVTYSTESGMTNYFWNVPSPGGTITAGGGAGDRDVTVRWDVAGPQTVSVTYTDVNSCSAALPAVFNFTVNGGVAMPGLTGPAAACEGDTNNIYRAESGQNSYVWTVSVGGTVTAGGGTADDFVTVTWTTPGSRSVKVTYKDADNCPALSLATMPVTVSPATVPTLIGEADVCANESGVLYKTESGQTNYQWSIIGGSITSGGTVADETATVTWNATGPASISVNYTATGCPTKGPVSFPVTIHAPPVATIDPVAPACSADPLPNVVIRFTGTAPYDFTYTVDGTPVSVIAHNSNTFTITNAAVGTYQVTALSDAFGCTSGSPSAAVAVVVSPSPTSAALVLTTPGTNTICAGTGTDLQVNITGGTAPYTITLNNGVGTINNYNSGDPITVSPTATTTYSLTGNITDAKGCTVAGTGSVAITVTPAPTASISGSTTICSGNTTSLTVTFTGTAPWTFTYSDGVNAPSPSISSPFSVFTIPGVNPTVTTTYTIMSVSDASVGGCAGTITGSGAIVTVNNPPSASLAVTSSIAPATLCTGGSTTIKVANAQNGVSYQLRNDADNSVISSGTGTGADLLLSTGPLAANTTFNVLASVTGCTAVQLTQKVTVNVSGSINAGLTVAPEVDPICAGSSTNIKVTASENGVLYQLRNDADDSNVGSAVASSGGDILLPTGVLTAQTTFNIFADNGTCSIEFTNKATVHVDVAPDPSLAVGVNPATPICVGGQANITVANSQNNLSYQLRNNADDSNVGGPVTGTGGTISLPTGALTTTTVFNVFVTSGSCASVELTATQQVDVNGTLDATLAVTAAASPMCKGDATTITITNAEAGVDYQLMDDLGNNIGTPVTGAGADITISTGPINRNTVFSVFADNGTCSMQLNNTAPVNMDIAPDPALIVSGPSTAICIGGSTNITVQASQSGVNYQLFNDDTNTAIGSPVAGTGSNLLLSTAALNITTRFRVEASSAGGACPMVVLANKPQVIVGGTIDTTLPIINTATPSFCSGSSALVKVGGSPGPGSQTGVTYQLQTSPGGVNVGSAVPGNGVEISLPTGNITTTTTFQVLASNGTCSILLTATTTITVSPAPNTSLTVETNSPICFNTAASVIIRNSQAGVAYQLRNNVGNVVVDGPRTSTGGDFTLSTGPLTASANFNVLAGSGSCTAQLTAPIAITVKSAGDPTCTGGTGNCATVKIVPRPHPATCTLSTGSVTFTVNPYHPAVVTASSELEITITGPVSRTNINDTTFYNLPLGTYTYSIQYGQTTCVKTGSFTIDQSGTVGTPVASGIVQPNCAGSNQGAVTINIAGETGNSMQWSYDAGITDPWKPFTVGGQITGIPAGPAPSFQRIISVRRNSSDPCNAAVTIVLQDRNSAIAATFNIGEATCNGNDGTLTVNAAGGTGGYQYSLDGTNYQGSKDFTDLPGGGGMMFVKDNAGCEVTLPYVISFPGSIAYNTPVPSPASCVNNGESGNITFSLTNLVAPGTYKAAISTDMFTEPTHYRNYISPSITFDTLAAGTYYIFVKPANGSSVCATRTSGVIVTGVTPITYQINQGCDPDGLNADKPFLYITDITGDTDFTAPTLKVSVSRVFPPAPNLLTKEADLSLGENFVSFSYEKDPVFMQFPGEYIIKLSQVAMSAGACLIEKTFKYTVPVPLTAVVSGTTKSFPEVPSGSMHVTKFFGGLAPYDIKIDLDSAASFALPNYSTDFEEVKANSNLDYARQYRNIPPGRYNVQVKDSLGCYIQFAGRVPLDTDVYIPNIFTPNDDGVNDVFFIRNLPSPGVKLVVTNRWGKEVFSTNDYKNDWKADGVTDGVYFYRIQGATSEAGKAMSGWIEVLRGSKP